MINLIPEEGKKAVLREYWTRMLSLWGLLIGGAAILSGLLFLPPYVLISLQLNALEDRIEEGNDAEKQYRAAEREVTIANESIEQLIHEPAKRKMTEVLDEVNKIAGNGIVLRRFEIGREEGRIQNFRIQGTATTREALATFKGSLEESPLFSSVVLPISDLAHDVDLPFAITITIDEDV